jgi:hypothetical protein
MRTAAGAIRKRLGHEGGDHAVFVRNLAYRHLHEREIIRGLQRIGIGKVDFELTVAVLVIDLIHIDADSAQPAYHFIERFSSTKQTLVVITGLVEIVGGISRPQSAVGAARQQHELGLNAREHREAPRRQPRDLSLQRYA